MKKRSNLPRRAWATVLATLVHLMALLALGSKIPQLSAPQPAEDRIATVEVTLVRPQVPPRTRPAEQSSRPAPATPRVPPRVLIAPTPGAPTLSARPKPEVAESPPDCAPEDLPLLTDAEKTRCRNQIDADKERRLAQGLDEKAARQVAEATRGPQAYRMDADKEAGYDASAHPAPLAPHLPTVGPGVSCGQVTFPLLSGVETNPNLFAKKHKQERPSHGGMKCGGHM